VNQGIPERDWKQFKRVHARLLEEYCERVLSELATAASAGGGSAHERYLNIYKLIKKRDETLGVLFDDFRRSTAEMQLAAMRREGLLSDEDLDSFSDETRLFVQRMNEVRRQPPRQT